MTPETVAYLIGHGYCPDCAAPSNADDHTVGEACPRVALARPEVLPGMTYLAFRGKHVMEYAIHGLNRDGSPRTWINGARHHPICPCQDEEASCDT